MAKTSRLAMAAMKLVGSAKGNIVVVGSQRNQDSTKKSYIASDWGTDGKTIVIRGEAGYMKMPSKEFGKAVGRLNAKEDATYKDNDYKAPTMRNNLRKGNKYGKK